MGTPHSVMPIVSGKTYILYNHQGGTALDLDIGSKNVQGWTYLGGPNQQVRFIFFLSLFSHFLIRLCVVETHQSLE